MGIKPIIIVIIIIIIDSLAITHNSFADGMQVQMSTQPNKISEQLYSMQSCIGDVKTSSTAIMLTLSDNKTELMLFTSKNI